jgi:tripartite-type tricarboxylate transporter receptor subunit TctC
MNTVGVREKRLSLVRGLAVATSSIIVSAMAWGSVGSAAGQVFPTHAITVVAAGPAGGPTDAVGRVIADRMRASLGQPVLIENVAASGGIAVRRVGRAAPDGYTIELGHWGTNVVDGAVMTLAYNLLTDFEPVALIASNPLLITAKNEERPASDQLKGTGGVVESQSGQSDVGRAGRRQPAAYCRDFFRETH